MIQTNVKTNSFFKAPNGSFAILRLCTFVLITFLSTTSQYYILWPWLSGTSATRRASHFSVFNVGIFFIYWTFYLSCRDPGSVSAHYVPIDDTEARYCKKCEAFKPPRSHHCKRCDRCILRMDHHCPWLSSCVGYSNHAAFIKFLSWVVPTTGYLAVMTGLRLYEFLTDKQSPTPQLSTIIMIVLNFIGAVTVCLMTACLHIYQLWCAIENITTIESWNKSRVEALIKKKKIAPIDFPYDLYSSRKNLKEIMGHHSPLLWLWPPSGATGTGHDFPVNEDADIAQLWPPKDPDNVTITQENTAKTRMVPDGEVQSVYDGCKGTDPNQYDDAKSFDDSDDSEDDYANEEGEYLDNYGVDDEDETTQLDEVVVENLTMRQLLVKRRSGSGATVMKNYANSRKSR